MSIKQQIKQQIKYIIVLAKENRSVVLTSLMAGVIVDIFLLPMKTDISIFVLMGLYFLSIRVYNFNSKTTFSFCFLLLLLLFIGFIFSGASGSTEKAAVWLFLFMASGIIQELHSTKNETV